MTASRRCSATTQAGQPCRAWAVPGSDPPLCAAHGGASRPSGPPLGNLNAQTHGVYSQPDFRPADLPAAIADLDRRIRSLSSYIDQHTDLDASTFCTLIKLQGELTSRLGRLCKIWVDLSAEEAGELSDAINEALDLIADNWQVEL